MYFAIKRTIFYKPQLILTQFSLIEHPNEALIILHKITLTIDIYKQDI
jgi:hypothetical protein